MQINLNHYKGAIIEYCCTKCKIINNFTEDFSNKISKIKSERCEHFDIKFIYSLEKCKLKYSISFNCKKCGQNELFNIFNDSKDLNIHYKCKKCKNGDINVQMLLIDEIIEEDEKTNNKNYKYDNEVKKIFNFENNNIKGANNNLNKLNNNYNIKLKNNMNLIENNQNQIIINNNFNFNNNNIINFNMMMGNMNINNINDDCQDMLNQNNNKKEIGIININFRRTKGGEYKCSIDSLNWVFSKVVRKFLKEHEDIDENKINAFLFNGKRVEDYKTLKQNNINENDTIMIYEI